MSLFDKINLPQIYKVHSFTSGTSTFAVTGSGDVEVLVIGAGAGGSADNYGGGGSGGMSEKSGHAVTAQSYNVVVGTGGAGGVTSGATDPAAGIGSNGDVNTTGGQGGYHRGGGAVGLTGTGENGVRAERNGSAGECDIVGDLWSSTMGQIAGGRRGISSYACSGNTERPTSSSYPNAEPFSGGGRVVVRRTPSSNSNFAQGGDGGIGGGGGAGINEGTSAYSTGGAGGAGLVVIQYIP
mgnify:CR=1 FL=1